MLGTHGIFLADALPRIGGELLDAKGHLAGLTVKGEDLGLYLVANLKEFLCTVETGAPGHLGNMYETLYAGLYLDECAVIGHCNYLTLNGVTNLEVWAESLPRMGAELLETKGDALLLLVEVKDDDVDLLIKGDNLFRM